MVIISDNTGPIDPENGIAGRGDVGGRLGLRQGYALGVIACLMAVDGFDLVSLGLVASRVGEELRAAPAAIGFALSAAQLGSIVSCAAIGRLNERFAERRLLIVVGIVMVLGSVLCALSPDIWSLMAARIVIGLGLGAALPLAVGYLSGSFAAAVRGRVVAGILVGLSIGQIVAGIVAPPIIARFGWRGMFLAGALVCLALLPLLFGLTGGRPGSAPQEVSSVSESGRIGPLLRSGWGPRVIVLLPAVLGGATTVYFLLNWLPFLARGVGLSAAASAGCASLLAAGGLLGVLTWGLLFDRKAPPFAVLTASFLCAAALLCLISTSRVPAIVFLSACFFLGFFLIGGYNSMTMLIGKVFPDHAQVHLVGIMSMVGRTGGLLAPAAAGLLLSAGNDARALFLITAVLAGVVAGLLAAGANLSPPPARL